MRLGGANKLPFTILGRVLYEFAGRLVARTAEDSPSRYTTSSSKGARAGKIYILKQILVVADHFAAIHCYERNKRFGINGVAEKLDGGVALGNVNTTRVEAIRLRVVAAVDELALITVVIECDV